MLTVLSSWATPCGVASTTSALMDNLTTLGVDWQVIAPNRQPFIPPEKPYKAIFYTNEFEAVTYFSRTEGPIHIQYNNALFSGSLVEAIMNQARARRQRIIVTLHDSCISTSKVFEADIITSASVRLVTYARYRANFARVEHVPFGIPHVEYNPNPKKRIVSFGPGRNQDHLVKPIAEALGYEYRTFYGSHKWTPRAELLRELADSTLIVLYYPDTGAIVSSSALPMALGTARPVVVSNTTWFKPEDLVWAADISGVRNLDKLVYFADDSTLESVIRQALSEDTTERRARIEELKATASELKVAEKFKSLYYD